MYSLYIYSKSDENERATIFVLDEPEQIKKKIGSAVTDSEAEIKANPTKPGVSNLLTIHSSLSGKSINDLESHFLGKGYGELKAEVIELLTENLRPVRESYQELIKDKNYLDSIIKKGSKKANERAVKTLAEIYDIIGFIKR